MTEVLTAEAVRRRYLTLVAMRWFPTGLLIPVSILLPARTRPYVEPDRTGGRRAGSGRPLLELPTGGLADSLGRKRVLITSSFVGMASVAIYLSADSFGAFFAAFALQGVFRARQRPIGGLVCRCSPRIGSRHRDPTRSQWGRDRPRRRHRRRRPAQRAARHPGPDQGPRATRHSGCRLPGLAGAQPHRRGHPDDRDPADKGWQAATRPPGRPRPRSVAAFGCSVTTVSCSPSSPSSCSGVRDDHVRELHPAAPQRDPGQR